MSLFRRRPTTCATTRQTDKKNTILASPFRSRPLFLLQANSRLLPFMHASVSFYPTTHALTQYNNRTISTKNIYTCTSHARAKKTKSCPLPPPAPLPRALHFRRGRHLVETACPPVLLLPKYATRDQKQNPHDDRFLPVRFFTFIVVICRF